jgi:hypothetical protein
LKADRRCGFLPKVMIRLLVLFLLITIGLPQALALPIRETFYWPRPPTKELIAKWSSLPGKRGYVFKLDFPHSGELETILKLRNAESLLLEVSQFPSEDAVAIWTKLAAQGAVLVGLDAGLPTEDEIARLNRIGFTRITLILTSTPNPEESARLAKLRAQLTLNFAVRAYPKFMDKPAFMAIPPNTPLVFSTDYWPWYTHMDLFNLLPHPIRLRVRGMFPPDASVEYLRNIHRLEQVTVETDFDAPYDSDWDKFGLIPVRWLSRDWVPSPAGLAAFERSGPNRSLNIDTDRPLSPTERRRLDASLVPVEWVHSPVERSR